uniref:NADH-ubiquinone oxidoreductase chain 5 n=1 Tax=Coleoptera sp. ACP-2013 TaxID=2485033 RepID=A0A3G3MEK3_9COLE|nr:NADH dehydrogenase subunit 5 [Coleoptera sp. ACP-2013]
MYYNLFLFFSLILFFLSMNFLIKDEMILIEYNILSMNSVSIVMIIIIDWMSLMFSSVVLFISSMVIYYSDEYMSGDLNLVRFILLVVLFVLSMLLLIFSPNLISILLGWDGLGLISYCLVIYYQNNKSFNAGALTAFTNRLGDVALLISIAWMLNYGSWTFLIYLDFMKEDYIMQLISWLVILASLTKSAQIPFSSWLPAAMAAPTPVSSLVHSSTLVTAGVYLLIRFNYSFSSMMMNILLIISVITMFMSGLGANFEFDLKKIIALSTLSQLGLMMSILSLGDYKLSFFHLLSHALFKALLFMCAGNIIHNLLNIQDIRYMGSLIYNMPMTSSFMMICNFSLCGLPFLSGFYSKDLVVEVMSMQYLNMFIYMIYYISIGLTVSYSFRLIYYVLVGSFNSVLLSNLNEKNYIMLKSMSGLIYFVIFSGSSFQWLMFKVPYFIILPLFMKNLAIVMIILGMWLGYELAKFSLNYNLNSLNNLLIVKFLAMMWNMPILSTYSLVFNPLSLGKFYIKFLDQGWFEFYGNRQISNNLMIYSQFFHKFSDNPLKIYLLMFLLWIMLMLMLLMY